MALLLQAIGRTSPKNIVAIVVASSGGEETPSQRFKLVYSKEGRVHVTVLQPLKMAGYEVVDSDGWRQAYNPDRSTLETGPSPDGAERPTKAILDLIRKNYRVSGNPDWTVAGHRVVRLYAKSIYPEIGAVAIFVEPSSKFVMRIEYLPPAGKSMVRMDTLQAWFPENLPSGSFEIKTHGNVVIKKQQAPTDLKSLAHSHHLLGFRPISPHHLPFGFTVQKMVVSLGEGEKRLALSLSDGLMRGIIFEYRTKARHERGQSHDGPHHAEVRVGKITVLIAGDMPPVVRDKLLAAFTQR